MSYGYESYDPPRRKRRSWVFSCLLLLVILVFLLLALVLGLLFFVKPQISAEAGDVLAVQLDQLIDQKLDEQFGNLEGQVPPDFAGTVVVTEADVNSYIEANPQEIAPLSQAQIHFLPGEMQADARAYGLSGTAYAGIAVSEGRLAIVSPRIEGSLGLVLDADNLATSLQSSLNQQLRESGLRVTNVSVEQGQLILSVAGQ